ncbi:hypothetical protein [Rubrimonas cliftonensis]|uniref:Uncharacterized protein n=1 Tax=Rubrimonas cliftonensis TaxID=89524 RepID=A0A1H4F9R2_9RHOB|nr:hypothetical protein [Rubrimonas cliftonensis]SEA93610.1 hypothetical protein SAMN05444370_11940 [Rubrimonas cliftonensis]
MIAASPCSAAGRIAGACAALLAAGAVAGEARLLPQSTDDAKVLEVSGAGPTLIYEWATVDGACRAAPPPAFYALQHPAHGTLSGRSGDVRLRTGEAASCPQAASIGSQLFYTPAPGFSGRDGFVLRMVEADGAGSTFRVSLQVR